MDAAKAERRLAAAAAAEAADADAAATDPSDDAPDMDEDDARLTRLVGVETAPGGEAPMPRPPALRLDVRSPPPPTETDATAGEGEPRDDAGDEDDPPGEDDDATPPDASARMSSFESCAPSALMRSTSDSEELHVGSADDVRVDSTGEPSAAAGDAA
jgi:hypothetical protein